MRYNLLGNGGHWFPGLNAAGLDEHDLRPCLARSPFAGRIIEALAEAHRMLAGEECKRLGKE
jgi:predicted aldo/keto reductase-like oxidoreductase